MERLLRVCVWLVCACEAWSQGFPDNRGYGISSWGTFRTVDGRQTGDDLLSTGAHTVSAARLKHRPASRAADAFERALKLASSGAWKQGAVELETAIAIDPAFSEAHGNLGAHYFHLGRVQDAVAQFRSAIRLDPATAAHHSNLAVALIKTHHWEEAELEARAALALDAVNPTAYLLLGYLLAEKPDRKEIARSYLEYAARFYPEARARLDAIEDRMPASTSLTRKASEPANQGP